MPSPRAEQPPAPVPVRACVWTETAALEAEPVAGVGTVLEPAYTVGSGGAQPPPPPDAHEQYYGYTREQYIEQMQMQAMQEQQAQQQQQQQEMAYEAGAYEPERVGLPPPPVPPMSMPPPPNFAPPQPSAPSAPDTVGMNRVAALEAKRAWRMQLADPSVGPPPPSAGSVSDREPIAGMTSEYRSRSVRGAVGQLDPASAADYNLSLKLAHATPRGNPALAPWVGGGERLQRLGAAEQPPLTDASNSMHANGMVPPSPLTGLSHAEKLQRMRELRQQADVEARQNLMSARNSPHM